MRIERLAGYRLAGFAILVLMALGDLVLNASAQRPQPAIATNSNGPGRVNASGSRVSEGGIGIPCIPDAAKTPRDGIDDLPSFNRCKANLDRVGGGVILLRARTYSLSSEFDLDRPGLVLVGQSPGASLLQPMSDSFTMIRIASSHDTIRNIGFVNGTKKIGIVAIKLAPVNESSSTPSNINYNVIDNVSMITTRNYEWAAGLLLRPGPSHGGLYFNSISNVFINNPTIGVYFEGTGASGSSSGDNGNIFTNVNVVQTGSAVVNAGFYIVEGGSNHFYGGSCNGVNGGTSPLATPTCFYVAENAPNGSTNGENTIDGLRAEGNKLDWDIGTQYTGGINVNGSTYRFRNGAPFVWLSEPTSGRIPTYIRGYEYDQNSATTTLGAVNGVIMGGSKVLLGSSSGPIWTSGKNDPNGVVSAPPGSLYSNTSGSGPTLYVKENGTGKTGWVGK
jgi:hypothetical protein